jgi:uncharacterized membrane protein YjdF
VNLKTLARRFIRIFAGISAVISLGLLSAAPVSAQVPTTQTTDGCYAYTNHEYEVCFAYLVNSSLAVLAPFYTYANSPNTTLNRYVTYRLGSRYYGTAYTTMASRVARWPVGNNHVAIPNIDILTVRSNLETNTATIVTQESWLVTDMYERTIYQEAGQRHVVQMARVPSYILHKWVVTDIR